MSQDTMPEQAVPVPPASPRQVALGMLILFQLVFLIVANIAGYIRYVPWNDELKDKPKKLVNRLVPKFADEEGHFWSWTDRIEAAPRRWMQLTGQDQDWSLFSPSVGKATGVPVVLLLWDEEPATGPGIPGSKLQYNAKDGFHLVTLWNPPAAPPDNVVWLPSENAPLDPNNYIRIGKVRVRRYEGEFYVDGLPYKDEPREDAAARMTLRMQKLVKNSDDAAQRYLDWRLRTWQRQNPAAPYPKQVLLCEYFFRIHGPKIEGEGEDRKVILEEHGWDGPFLIPQARWLPAEKKQKGQYLLQPFDYSDQRFHPLAQ
jgi:hypothetical protein